MRLGIFGDSYAAFVGRYESCPPWPKHLSSLLNAETFGHHALPGTSHWYAYEQFLRHYKNYDTIVFVHTNCERWPYLPHEQQCKAWNIGYLQDEYMDPLNKIRKTIFPSALLEFISLSIFKDVNDKCREAGIYLVNVFSFPDDYVIPATEFPIVKHLDYVSHLEKTKFQDHFPKPDFSFKAKFEQWINDESRYYPTQMIIKSTGGQDRRECHMNCNNNKRLAFMLFDFVKNKQHDIIVDCKQKEWDVFDNEMNKIYDNWLKEGT